MSTTRVKVNRIEIRWTGQDSRLSCQVVAEVSYPIRQGRGDRRLEWLSSGGLHDIDRPSPSYAREIEDDEITDLRNHLSMFGIVMSDGEWGAVARVPVVMR